MKGEDWPPREEPYISLYHLTALCPDAAHEPINIHLPLRVHHVQHGINDNERSRSPHASTGRKNREKIGPFVLSAGKQLRSWRAF